MVPSKGENGVGTHEPRTACCGVPHAGRGRASRSGFPGESADRSGRASSTPGLEVLSPGRQPNGSGLGPNGSGRQRNGSGLGLEGPGHEPEGPGPGLASSGRGLEGPGLEPNCSGRRLCGSGRRSTGSGPEPASPGLQPIARDTRRTVRDFVRWARDQNRRVRASDRKDVNGFRREFRCSRPSGWRQPIDRSDARGTHLSYGSMTLVIKRASLPLAGSRTAFVSRRDFLRERVMDWRWAVLINWGDTLTQRGEAQCR